MDKIINIKSRFVDKDEFLLYTGINLDEQLQDDDNISNKVESFIYRETRRFESFINAVLHINIPNQYALVSDYQKEQYKLALLEQLLYVFKNGNIGVDSGYNFESGVIASNKEMQSKYLSPLAKNYLINAGIYSTNMAFKGNWFYGHRFI